MNVWKEYIRELGGDILNKKFLVFVTATVLLLLHIISESSWLYATGAFLASSLIESRLVK